MTYAVIKRKRTFRDFVNKICLMPFSRVIYLLDNGDTVFQTYFFGVKIKSRYEKFVPEGSFKSGFNFHDRVDECLPPLTKWEMARNKKIYKHYLAVCKKEGRQPRMTDKDKANLGV